MNKVPENPSKNRIDSSFSLIAVSAVLITLYLTANLMAVKIIRVGSVSIFDAGTITFPFAFMLGDVLSEIWGFKIAKRVIFLSFLCNIILVLFTGLGIFLPYPDYMESVQQGYITVFGYVPRIVIASLISFLAGELINAKVLVVMKEKSKDGKLLFLRTIGSSVVGYAVDTTLFVVIAFIGTSPLSEIWSMIWIQYLAKLLIEATLGTPMAYLLVWKLKKKEALSLTPNS